MDQLALLHQNQFLVDNALLKLYSILDVVGEGYVSPENLETGENVEAEEIIVVVTDEEREENVSQVVEMEEDKRDGYEKVVSRDMDVNRSKETNGKTGDVVVAKISENEGELETSASKEDRDTPGELGEEETTIDKTEDNGEGKKEKEQKEEPKLPVTEVSSSKLDGNKEVEPGDKKEAVSNLQKDKMANRPKISRNDRRITRGSKTVESLVMPTIEDVYVPKGHETPLKDISNVKQIREVDGTREKKAQANDTELKSAISEIVKEVDLDKAIDVDKKGDNKWAVEVEEECEKEDGEKGIKKRRKTRACCKNMDADNEVKPMEKKDAELQKEKMANKPNISTDRPITRGRKSVGRLVIPILEEVPSENFHIEKSCGIAIDDFSNVGRNLSRKKTGDAFELLNRILVGRKREKVEINISRFSGVDNEEKEIIKVENRLRKCLKAVLLDLCVALGIPLPERKDSILKEKFIVMLLDYLVEPCATNSDLLAEKEQRNGEDKEHAICA